uniref:Uncharacterized protein n=1 Tax=Chromulina nebulosa TaxID=96789 RepID=A0A7S0ST89_9STRA|mmetsp:Transcript_3309/g.2943  ORF Transcript_3309/g.2943 Transcript_3309/m.2943 type:complete len:123 (+) Transcript_3309:19-387(+)
MNRNNLIIIIICSVIGLIILILICIKIYFKLLYSKISNDKISNDINRFEKVVNNRFETAKSDATLRRGQTQVNNNNIIQSHLPTILSSPGSKKSNSNIYNNNKVLPLHNEVIGQTLSIEFRG